MPATTSTSSRPTPHVPHHAVVRAIGRGSYGEIWLARSLTGAWRAVKIVERARFDDTRSFEREFDGMAKFEPVSREHEGFVDILHVGRSDDDGFFYYVMELADDTVARPVFDSAVYEPKTLRSELQRVARLPCAEAITLGLSLTAALAALHRHGLVHRDIKPANIIFVGGQPKIADIGLVSALGQMSFVGTEGYVPPEGPGTVQADIYSLGKVLYELAMGKDRLEFPAVSTSLYELPDREQLLQLNEVLLRACAQYPAERYACAEEMHRDLLLVRDGLPLSGRRKKRRWLPVAALLLVGASAGAWMTFAPPSEGLGSVYLETDPPNVKLILESHEGRWQSSPVRFDKLPAGEHVVHVIAPLTHEKTENIHFTIRPGEETRPDKIILRRSVGEVQVTSDPPGCAYELREGDSLVRSGSAPQTLDALPTGPYQLVMRHLGQEKRAPLEIGRGKNPPVSMAFGAGKFTVRSTPEGAEIFSDGQRLGTAPFELPLVEGEHEIVARYKNWPPQTRKVMSKPGAPELLEFEFEFGRAKIYSSPRGAEIFHEGVKIPDALTPHTIENLPPGEAHFTLQLAGYQPQEKTVMIVPGKQEPVEVEFDARPGPRKGEPWTNSIGMKFAPVGDILVGVWPVRVLDYARYSLETGKPRLQVDFPHDDQHPVVRIKWDDAVEFCKWLTIFESENKKLDVGEVYRLPTDAEWSMAVGLPEERGETPEMRDGLIRDLFPWGKSWPPPPNSGNFADEKYREVVPKSGGGRVTFIAGYKDSFPHTSPVGAFPPNKFGLFDMTGNVWQWMGDSYNSRRKDWGVLRGGSWGTSKKEELSLGYRNVMKREESDVVFGFRVVIAPEK